MAKSKTVSELKEIADRVRCNILKMTSAANSGHPGGSMSAADIGTVLYFSEMNFNPKKPEEKGRDRFVLSKGHCVPMLYAIFHELGMLSEKDLLTLRQVGSKLQGHSDRKMKGIEMSTGSLGQGLSVAVGMALAGKLNKADYNVYCMLGDGEMQEGSIWEAAMAASHYKLDNLIAIVDINGLQIDGEVKDIMNIMPLDAKFTSFGWRVIEIDGHDIENIISALQEAKDSFSPLCILAKTAKGKGVSFMENKCEFHGKALKEEELESALKELENKASMDKY